MIVVYAALAIVAVCATIYFAAKSFEFRKFLAGAFFVSGGVQLYLSVARVSVPLLGTSFVQTPELGRVRCVPHFVLCGLCLYFGFIRKPRGAPTAPAMKVDPET